MTKRRRSISLDADLDDEIADLDHPFSPLVNKWVRDYVENGRRPAMDRHRIQRLIEQVDAQQAAFNEAAEQVNAIFDAQRATLTDALGRSADVDDLDAALEEAYNRMTERFEEERLVSNDRSKTYTVDNSVPRDPENPAVRNEAQKLGISPERLVYELETRDVRDGFADEITHPTPERNSEVSHQ